MKCHKMETMETIVDRIVKAEVRFRKTQRCVHTCSYPEVTPRPIWSSCVIVFFVFVPGASAGGGGRALQHRGHRLPVGHPPGPGAQPCRYRCSALLAPPPPLSWTLSSLLTPPSNPVPGRKRTDFSPGRLSPVADCKEGRCLTSCLSRCVQQCCVDFCFRMRRLSSSVRTRDFSAKSSKSNPVSAPPVHWNIFDKYLLGSDF